FFMRVEWALEEDAAASERALSAFGEAFAPIATELGMRWTLKRRGSRPRVALFCSQYLHCLADLLYRANSGELDCEIAVVVSNHREAEALAAFYGVRFEYVPVTAATRATAEAMQLALLDELGVELVVLARYMQILTDGFVARYPVAIIN